MIIQVVIIPFSFRCWFNVFWIRLFPRVISSLSRNARLRGSFNNPHLHLNTFFWPLPILRTLPGEWLWKRGKRDEKNNKSPVPRNRVPEKKGRGPQWCILVLCSGFSEWTCSLSEPNSWLLTCHGLVSQVEFFRIPVVGSRDLNSKLQHQHQEHSGFCLLWLACWVDESSQLNWDWPEKTGTLVLLLTLLPSC